MRGNKEPLLGNPGQGVLSVMVNHKNSKWSESSDSMWDLPATLLD